MAATALGTSAADARSIKWARSGDALTLDPHAQNEGPTTNLGRQIYEPLVERDACRQARCRRSRCPGASPRTRRSGNSSCARASSSTTATRSTPTTSCSRSSARASRPRTSRATSPRSNRSPRSTPTRCTSRPRGPIRSWSHNLTNLLIMDKEWSEAEQRRPSRRTSRTRRRISRFATPTAPARSRWSRASPTCETVFKRNDAYWGRGEVALEITELVLHPDQGRCDAGRRAALGRGRFRPGRSGAGYRAPQGLAQPARHRPVRRTAPSSSAWTWARRSCDHPTSRARTRSPTCGCARR